MFDFQMATYILFLHYFIKKTMFLLDFYLHYLIRVIFVGIEFSSIVKSNMFLLEYNKFIFDRYIFDISIVLCIMLVRTNNIIES